VITENGGSLASPDGIVSVTVPPAAVDEETSLSLFMNANAIPIPGTRILASFRLEARQVAGGSPITAFAAPVQITVHPEYLEAFTGQPLTLATWGPNRWQPLPTQVDLDSGVVIAQTTHFSVFALIAGTIASDAVLLAPFIPSEPSNPPPPYIFYENTVIYEYTSGPVTLSSTPDGSGELWTDDKVVIKVTRPDGTSATFEWDYRKPGPGITPTPPQDVTYLFLPGNNTVHIEVWDQMVPVRGTSGYYLVPVAADTIPPTISDVYWRQNGKGQMVVEATVTDNVAVAAVSLWWNGQEYSMSLIGPDRYTAVIPTQLNGLVGNFRITAVDPSGNLGFWPASGLTQEERIRYNQWAGQKRNTRSDGEPVNTATGSFYTQHQDLYAPAPGMPFNFTRIYNSVSAALDGPFGYGTSHSYYSHLREIDDALLTGVELIYPDGRMAEFPANGGGFDSPPGDNNILTREGSSFVLTWPDQTRYQYDNNGNLVSIEDANHNVVQLSYTGSNLTQITDTAGRTYLLEYEGSYIRQITDPLSRVYTYSYDGRGNLQTYRDPEGGLIQYSYNSDHWMRSITDPNGHTFVRNEYDDRGRVVKQWDASSTPSTFTYLDEQHVVFTDGEGNPTTYAYDDQLRIIAETDANGKSITYQYDSDDNPNQIVDRMGHSTWFTYDDNGNLLTRTDSLQQTAEFRYDALNHLVYARDESEAETTYEYDAQGNLTHIHDAEGGDTWLTYDSRGLIRSIQDANQNTTWFTYDAQGNLETVEDALHFFTRYTYDAMGRMLSMQDANQHSVFFAYNGNDRLLTITDPKGKATTFVYDPVGNLRSVTDRLGCTTLYEYNENDSLIKVIDPRGEYVTYTYDRAYHRLSFTNARRYTTLRV
jgi:YD repeat-containing protein